MQLKKNSKTEHINQSTEKQQFSLDEITKLRRQKLQEIKAARNPSFDPIKTDPSFDRFSSDPTKKKKKKEEKKEAKKRIKQKEKELYNKTSKFNKPLIQNTSYSSFYGSLKVRSEKPDQVENNEKPTRNKRKTNNLSPKQRRSLLSENIQYSRGTKRKEISEIKVTRSIQQMFNSWNKLADEVHCILPIKKTVRFGKPTKIYKETCHLCSAFLNDKLKKHKLVVLPKYHDFNLLPSKKYKPKDFRQHLDWLKLRLTDSSYKQIWADRITLSFFLAGYKFNKTPSLLLAWCWTEPKRIVTFDYEEYFPILVDGWEQAGGCNIFTTKDLKNFDDYFGWALPHFKRLKNSFNSLNSFDDELDVLEFFTFGVLRQFKYRGKNFTTNILNQEFFKTMMEDLRKRHGYTV